MKFYQTLNQTPKGPRHGKHRRTSPPAHGHSVIGADHGARGTDQDITGLAVLGSGWSVTYTRLPGYEPTPEPTPPAIPYAGIRTGEIIGHRLWWVHPTEDGPELCSLAHVRLWKPGEVVQGDVEQIIDWDYWLNPIWGGVYAFGDLECLLSELEIAKIQFEQEVRLRTRWSGIFDGPAINAIGFVAGTIKMWGDVVEHELGYRAQYAKLNSIDSVHGDCDLDDLRRRYFPA